MSNDEPDMALGEYLIPVLADVQSCRAYKFWRKTFGHIGDGQNALYVGGEFETIADATILFSLISLRKIDEFLSNDRKRKSTDIHYSEFEICRDEILMDREDVLPKDVRQSINQTIAHFTDLGQPSAEDWEKFEHVLEAAEPTLKRLELVIECLLEMEREDLRLG